jgi:hypothetical protein
MIYVLHLHHTIIHVVCVHHIITHIIRLHSIIIITDLVDQNMFFFYIRADNKFCFLLSNIPQTVNVIILIDIIMLIKLYLFLLFHYHQ